MTGRLSTKSCSSSKLDLIKSIFDWVLWCYCLIYSKVANIFSTTPSKLPIPSCSSSMLASLNILSDSYFILWTFEKSWIDGHIDLPLKLAWKTPICIDSSSSYLFNIRWIFFWILSHVCLKIKKLFESHLVNFWNSVTSFTFYFLTCSQCSMIGSLSDE